MNRIGLIDCDATTFPNYALMKLAAYHKSIGDVVEWRDPFSNYDKTYASAVFTFSPGKYDVPADAAVGGTGFDVKSSLPTFVDDCEPDYSLYPDFEHAIGFLTRGCIRRCDFCFVPEKEGRIRPYRDADTVLSSGHRSVILLDNNVLASDHGIQEIEKLANLGVKVDFNQGLDARLIDDAMARLLSKVKWLFPLRMSCDSVDNLDDVTRAIEALRWHNVTPRRYFIYLLVKDDQTALERIRVLKGYDVDVFAQPFLGPDAEKKKSSKLVRWCNKPNFRKTMTYEEYCSRERE